MHLQGITSIRHHQITQPTAARRDPTVQANMPGHQQGEDTTTQNRSCPRCSMVQRTQVRPTAEHPVGHEGARQFGVSSRCDDNTVPLITALFKNTNTSYLNQDQNVNNRSEAGMVPAIPEDRIWAPETAVSANVFSHVTASVLN
jgi:hypothetical protein